MTDVWIVNMFVNEGWGTRFDNYDRLTLTEVFSNSKSAHDLAKSYTKDCKRRRISTAVTEYSNSGLSATVKKTTIKEDSD